MSTLLVRRTVTAALGLAILATIPLAASARLSAGNLKVTVQVIGKTLTMFAADFTPIPPLALGAGVFLQHIDFAYDAGPPLTLLGVGRLI